MPYSRRRKKFPQILGTIALYLFGLLAAFALLWFIEVTMNADSRPGKERGTISDNDQSIPSSKKTRRR